MLPMFDRPVERSCRMAGIIRANWRDSCVKALPGGAMVVALWAAAISFCGRGLGLPAHEQNAPEAQAAGPAGASEIQMRNVNFRLARDIILEVHTLRGRLQRTKPEVPVTFDDSESFIVEIDSAQVAIAPASLTALMNSYVLAYDGAPIKHVVTIEGDSLIQKGTINKGVDLPF